MILFRRHSLRRRVPLPANWKDGLAQRNTGTSVLVASLCIGPIRAKRPDPATEGYWKTFPLAQPNVLVAGFFPCASAFACILLAMFSQNIRGVVTEYYIRIYPLRCPPPRFYLLVGRGSPPAVDFNQSRLGIDGPEGESQILGKRGVRKR